MEAGIYETIPGEGNPVVYKPMTQKEFDIFVKMWGKSMTITEFLYTSQNILDNYGESN